MDNLRSSFELAFTRLRDLNVPQTALVVTGTIGAVWITSKLLRELSHLLFPNILPGEPNTVLLASPRPARQSPATAKDLSNVREYDYIIVGTGTAGAVIANRLTENRNVSVLAIEAGHSDVKQLMSRIPAGFSQLFHGAADWDLKTKAQANCNARQFFWPRGKMLGGCSAINAMIYNKGAPDDYDEWERLGNHGWNYKDLVPFMNKAEGFTNASDPRDKINDEDLSQHGRTGPWKIGFSHLTEISRVFIEACAAVGFQKIRDQNTRAGPNGVTRCQTFIDTKGQRSSTATAYFTEDVVKRPNLKIATAQNVTRIIFDTTGSRPRAVGVEMAAGRDIPVRYLAKARKEVIVSAGAVNTPQILKLSGIGPANEIAAHGIKLIQDLPGVGANLADHIFGTWVYTVTDNMSVQRLSSPLKSGGDLIEWLRHGTGIMTGNIADAIAFTRTADRPDAPESLKKNDLTSGPTSSDLEILTGAVAYIDHGAFPVPAGDYSSTGPIMLRPESRGTVTLASADPFTPPVVDANYLATQHDRDLMVYGMKLARDIIRSAPMKPHFKKWFTPPRWAQNPDTATDAEILETVRNTCETIYHPMCSAKMGPASDRAAVVDPALRVYGVDGLRIADASVFPMPVACHPCAPVVMVGEKAADLIKAGA